MRGYSHDRDQIHTAGDRIAASRSRRADSCVLPRRRGIRGARRGADLLGAIRRRRPGVSAPADVGDRPFPIMEVPDPLLRASRPRGHFRRRVATGAPIGRSTCERTAPTTSPEMRSRSSMQADASGRLCVSWGNAGEELMLAAEHPERVYAIVLIAPDLRDRAAGMPRKAHPFDEPLTLRGVGEVEPELLGDD